jgi:hypothetical protein
MEERPIREGSPSERDEGHDVSIDAIIANIQSIAAYNARAPLATEKQVLLYLKSWWSKTYNRPLKDPLLETYTLEELLYEFHDKIEREKAAIEAVEQDSDKIEQAKEKESLDWAEQEEKRELEELAKKEINESNSEVDPTKNAENIRWMEEQIRAQKELLGEDFGEDINFSEE